MRALKTGGMWLLMLVLTAAIVIVPPLWSERETAMLIAQEETWEYEGYPADTITDDELALMIWNGEISIGAYSWLDGSSYNSMDVHDSAMLLLDAVFGDKAHYQQADHFSMVDVLAYDQAAGIAMKNGRPVVLSVITVVFQYSNTLTVELTFEEKTDTLMWIAYTCEGNDGEAQWVEQELLPLLERYYTEQLGLTDEQYVCGVTRWDESLYMYGEIIRKGETEKDLSEHSVVS